MLLGMVKGKVLTMSYRTVKMLMGKSLLRAMGGCGVIVW